MTAVPRGTHSHTGKPVERWEDESACGKLVKAGAADPEDWTCDESDREYAKRHAAAKLVCLGCPVRTECLEWATATRETEHVLGGLTPRERGRLARGTAGRATMALVAS